MHIQTPMFPQRSFRNQGMTNSPGFTLTIYALLSYIYYIVTATGLFNLTTIPTITVQLNRRRHKFTDTVKVLLDIKHNRTIVSLKTSWLIPILQPATATEHYSYAKTQNRLLHTDHILYMPHVIGTWSWYYIIYQQNFTKHILQLFKYRFIGQ